MARVAVSEAFVNRQRGWSEIIERKGNRARVEGVKLAGSRFSPEGNVRDATFLVFVAGLLLWLTLLPPLPLRA